MAKKLGLGTTVTFDGSSWGSYKSATPLNQEANEVDVTGLDATAKEYIVSTLVDNGTSELTVFVEAGFTKPTIGTSGTLVFTYPTGHSETCTAWVKSFKFNEITPDGELTATIGLRATGAVS